MADRRGIGPTHPNAPPGVSRRGLLSAAVRGGAVTGALGLTAGAGPAVAAAATRASGARNPPDAITFFADPVLNFEALWPLASAAYGAADVGEILTVFNRVHARGNTYGAYCEEFLAEGGRLAAAAEQARHRGHRVTARDRFLRATQCFNQALFFVLASSRPTRAQEAHVYRRMEGCFAAAASLSSPAFERVMIPYEPGRPLPGWLMTPPGPRIRRPTLILTNGSDDQNIDMYVTGGRAAIERGWNALIYEGPGQGANLFLHDIPFRPDWEAVVTPIVEFLRAHPGVDRRRIALSGVSFSGCLVPRAAAYEHRLAALVVDPGVTDGFYSWSSSLPRYYLELFHRREQAKFDAAWKAAQPYLPPSTKFYIAKRAEIYGRRSFYDQLSLAQHFVLSPEVVARVRAPTLITEPQDETFFPGMSAKLFSWLRTADRELMPFTVAEGAQFHCEAMAPTVRNEAVFDWLETHLRPTA